LVAAIWTKEATVFFTFERKTNEAGQQLADEDAHGAVEEPGEGTKNETESLLCKGVSACVCRSIRR